MKEQFLTLYNSLEIPERRNLWLGIITFSIGFFMSIFVLFPPSWNGWKETKGEITSAQSIEKGTFSGGAMLFHLKYATDNAGVQEGTFTMSPIILSTMKTIRVFYKKDNPSVFYIHNPTWRVIALMLTFLGGSLLLTYYLYYRDKLRGITYD